MTISEANKKSVPGPEPGTLTADLRSRQTRQNHYTRMGERC